MAQEATEAPVEGQEPEATPDPKEGQEPKPEQGKTFDEGYVKQLRAEAANYRKEAQEAKTRVQEFEERDQSETEKLTGKLTKAEQAKADAEAKLLRYEVATEKNVPSKLVPLLTAASKEELEAQAELILENAKPADPSFDGGAREEAPEPKAPAAAHDALAMALLGGRPKQL